MSEVDIGEFVRFALVAAALVFSVIALVRDRREHRRVEALFEANAARHQRRNDNASEARRDEMSMAYTMKEFTQLDLAKVRREPRCICEGVKDTAYRCADCCWNEFSDFLDAHPIGMPGSWRGSAPR